MATRFGQAGTAKYVLLTTFRKDGTAVSSPLWAVLEGDELLMWTVTDSWKIKRLRRNPSVIVQACDRMGRETYGEPVKGSAVLLDLERSERTRKAMVKKYGLLGRLVVGASVLRRGKGGTVGVAIAAD